METFHNPDRFMADLRQVLSQGRKRVGLLIGAGAPLSIRIDDNGNIAASGKPIIPGIESLTSRVLSSLKGADAGAAEAIRVALGTKANIETILSRVRLLQQALGKVQVEGLDGDGYKKLGETMCKEIGVIVGGVLPPQRNAYSELVAWISGTVRSHAVEVFTTNYDLLLEEAFERARAPYFDGFTGGHQPFFDPVTVAGDDLPSRWSRLWKLHGSLGWALEGERVVRKEGRAATQLVYPDHLKYDLTQKQPYSALFERLKEFLLTPDTLLLTTGFSFRDAHVCAVLDEALAMNANTAVLAFQYGALANEQPAVQLALDHPNVSVFASDAAVVSGVPGKWRLGDPPRGWEPIRATFWKFDPQDPSKGFLLGDFAHFTRFCALTQALDVARSPEQVEAEPAPEAAVDKAQAA